MTGIFWGLEPKDSERADEKIFDFAIIVKFNSNYKLENIYQISWQTFLDKKSWHSRTKGWRIILTKDFIEAAKKLL